MKRTLLVLLSFFLLLSCSKEEPGTQVDVDTDFLIDIKEDLSVAGSTLLFDVSTIDMQECLNSSIVADFQKNNTAIRLSFLDILTPTDCEEGSAPAVARIYAGDLAVRDYSFKIDLRSEVESTGVLNVLSDRYIISFVRPSGFQFAENILLRVPRNTIWGYVNHTENEIGIADAFIDNLSQNATPTDLEEGYYGWFKGAGAELTELDNLPTEKMNTMFVFNYEGEDELLENAIADFRMQNPDVEVTLFDWRGKSF